MVTGVFQQLYPGLGNPLGLLFHKPLDRPFKGEPGSEYNDFPVMPDLYGNSPAARGNADGVGDGFPINTYFWQGKYMLRKMLQHEFLHETQNAFNG